MFSLEISDMVSGLTTLDEGLHVVSVSYQQYSGDAGNALWFCQNFFFFFFFYSSAAKVSG